MIKKRDSVRLLSAMIKFSSMEMTLQNLPCKCNGDCNHRSILVVLKVVVEVRNLSKYTKTSHIKII